MFHRKTSTSWNHNHQRNENQLRKILPMITSLHLRGQNSKTKVNTNISVGTIGLPTGPTIRNIRVQCTSSNFGWNQRKNLFTLSNIRHQMKTKPMFRITTGSRPSEAKTTTPTKRNPQCFLASEWPVPWFRGTTLNI